MRKEVDNMSKMNTRTKKRTIKQIMMIVLCIITFTVCCIVMYNVAGKYDVDAVDKVHNLVAVEDSTGHTWECYADGLVEGQEVIITLFDTYLDDTIENNQLIDIKPIDIQILEP